MERTYTDTELEEMKPENRPKVEFEGKEYDDYEATQMQRKIERTIRREKRLKIAYESTGLTNEAQNANIKLRQLNEKYRAFSKAAGLPEQRERMQVKYADSSSAQKAAALKARRDAETTVREAIRRGDYPLNINSEKQARHMSATAPQGRSVITISQEKLQRIVNTQAGKGHIEFTRSLEWKSREIIDVGEEIGYTINAKGDIIKTTSIKIHYSKTGVHAVPYSGRRGK